MNPTLRAQVLKWFAFDGTPTWEFDIITGHRDRETGNVALVQVSHGHFHTWREAYDAACAELRKRAES